MFQQVEGSASNFLTALESNLSSLCGVMLRKSDKKKDRQLLFNHRHAIVDQMEKSEVHCIALHYAAVHCIAVLYTAQLAESSANNS